MQQGTILFVDSDTNQLASLKRSLRGHRNSWQMLFAEDKTSALAVLAAHPVDIIVSETRLADGSGSDLLMRVQQNYPLTTRLLFSGQSLRDPAQEVVHHTHQFIAKPCELSTLTTILERAMELRALLHNPTLRQLINNLNTLPSLPASYLRLMQALRTESTTVKQIGQLVEQDLAMSTKVLQMVNSAFFGLRRRIASPVHAVSLLGIETVTNLALTAGLFDSLEASIVESFDLQSLWSHSLQVAGLTRELCHLEAIPGSESEIPILAGLLHDLGQLVLATSDTEEYRRVVTLANSSDAPLHLAENDLLKADHAAVGAYLMGLWGLPFRAVEAVALHHRPDLQDTEHLHCLLVYAANLLINHYANNSPQSHYNLDKLASIAGRERLHRWSSATLEYLDGETAREDPAGR